MRIRDCALVMFLALAATSTQAATVEVQISGVSPGQGPVQVALCASALEPELCQNRQTVAAEGASVRVAFADVAPGRYAVAAFQDVDGTGVLRRGKLGIPLEPYGFSNGAGLSRRPKFEAAAFNVSDAGLKVNVALRPTRHRSGPEE
jgi:uncharacterized protein (DUF2141 family)